jgi:hypothetical protein
MSNEVTLAQLAAEIGQLRQQIEMLSQHLDMIYGAVARLADAKQLETSLNSGGADARGRGPQSAAGGGRQGPEEAAPSASTANMPLSASMMMDPGNMLDSLRQYAVSLGMNVSAETVDRLKSDLPTGKSQDEPQ